MLATHLLTYKRSLLIAAGAFAESNVLNFEYVAHKHQIPGVSEALPVAKGLSEQWGRG